jgi:hypothetical protein
MNPRNFFSELKRRNVYNVAVAYGIVGWLLVQITTQVFPIFEFRLGSAIDRDRISDRPRDRVDFLN